MVYVPEPYRPDGSAPAILFLHGRGESGTDGLLQVSQGLGVAIMKARERWPALVIFPQKATQEQDWWSERPMLQAILKAVEGEWATDAHRRTLTGLSQGGHGTFRLARHLAWQFAAVAPICGWVDPQLAAKELADMPMWAFHGDADPVVPVEGTVKAIEAIRAAGGNPTVTIYPGVGHNSWDRAYQESDLAAWLLRQTLG